MAGQRNGRRLPAAPAELTIGELITAYWRHAEGYYRKPDGTPTTEADKIKASLRVLDRLYGDTSAAQFGPLALKTVREEMIRLGWCRNHINQSVGRLRRCFKWGVENELVPAMVYHGLAAAMIRLQRLTGARSGEICSMRGADLDDCAMLLLPVGGPIPPWH